MEQKKESKNIKLFVGIDVSKDTLDIHMADQHYQISNQELTITKFIHDHMDSQMIQLCVLESTGGYERLILSQLHEAGIAVHRAHPSRVHAFAKACNHFAKTDKLDAKLLCKYAAFISSETNGDTRTSIDHEKLKELRRVLRLVEEQLHSAQCRQKQFPKECQLFFTQQIRFYKKQIKSVANKIEAVVNQNVELKSKIALMQSMSGVGLKSATMLLAEVPELGQLTKKTIASLVGLAPKTNESGKKVQLAHIQGGRFYARKIIYMCALVASKHSAKMKLMYTKLLAAGKPKKLALVAIMRKMIITLNAMLKNNTRFDLNYA